MARGVIRPDTEGSGVRYVFLTLFAIAFGVEEAIIVLYLRLLPAQHGQIAPDTYHLEMAREISTLVILVAVAAVAATRLDQRLRYFLFSFGVWDIVYYIALWLLSGYPGFTSDDVLFLIPMPWVGPVWAVMSFAAALVLLGRLGVARSRAAVLVVGLALGWLSFVFVPIKALFSGHGLDPHIDLEPERYPIWLYVPAIACILISLPWLAGKRARERAA